MRVLQVKDIPAIDFSRWHEAFGIEESFIATATNRSIEEIQRLPLAEYSDLLEQLNEQFNVTHELSDSNVLKLKHPSDLCSEVTVNEVTIADIKEISNDRKTLTTEDFLVAICQTPSRRLADLSLADALAVLEAASVPLAILPPILSAVWALQNE